MFGAVRTVCPESRHTCSSLLSPDVFHRATRRDPTLEGSERLMIKFWFCRTQDNPRPSWAHDPATPPLEHDTALFADAARLAAEGSLASRCAPVRRRATVHCAVHCASDAFCCRQSSMIIKRPTT